MSISNERSHPLDPSKNISEDLTVHPIQRFSSRRLTRKETLIKREIDSYYVSDIDNTALIHIGQRSHAICHSLDLPDTICGGLIFKQRLIRTDSDGCMLLVRWKPDRHMRRNTPEWSQKWFIEKELFPPDLDELFARLEKRFEQSNEPLTAEDLEQPVAVALEE